MKKIVLAAAAVAAFGVAGCTNADTANNSADVNTTVNAAEVDVNGAATDAANSSGNAVTATENAGSDVGNAAGRAVGATGNAVEAGADAVGNAAHNATH
jgi:outer membrane lipoprotein SlyB